MKRVYLNIKFKTFYTTIECLERRLNPLSTEVIIKDKSKELEDICIDTSEKLQSQIKNNLITNPQVFKPNINKYLKYNQKIKNIYLKHLHENNIYEYSINETYLDITNYLEDNKYKTQDIINILISEIYKETTILPHIEVVKTIPREKKNAISKRNNLYFKNNFSYNKDYQTVKKDLINLLDTSITSLIINKYKASNITLFISYTNDKIPNLKKSINLKKHTNNYLEILRTILKIYNLSVNKNENINKIAISFNNLKSIKTLNLNINYKNILKSNLLNRLQYNLNNIEMNKRRTKCRIKQLITQSIN